MKYNLPKLPYKYDALEPYIDEQTMQIHHTKHHQGYVDKLNKAIEGTELEDWEIEEILKNIEKVEDKIRQAVINNGGGHANHSLFWQILSPEKTEPEGKLLEAINKKFDSLENFKIKFSEAATTRFGSGWAWLVLNEKKELQIISTPNQDSPLSQNKTPILGLDVWEHAYYLRYQNRRPEYIEAFWKIINWKKVSEFYEQATSD